MSGVHLLRTVEDALALKARLRPDRRLVIVGGGFIGAEVAATARALGVTVTLLEAGTVPMGQAVGDDAGRFLTRIHLAHGVDVRAGTSVHGIQSSVGRVTGVLLSDGSILLTTSWWPSAPCPTPNGWTAAAWPSRTGCCVLRRFGNPASATA
ncbi:FAD-dependent oxidoreductase [Streptomyces shaanxiensis]